MLYVKRIVVIKKSATNCHITIKAMVFFVGKKSSPTRSMVIRFSTSMSINRFVTILYMHDHNLTKTKFSKRSQGLFQGLKDPSISWISLLIKQVTPNVIKRIQSCWKPRFVFVRSGHDQGHCVHEVFLPEKLTLENKITKLQEALML